MFQIGCQAWLALSLSMHVAGTVQAVSDLHGDPLPPGTVARLGTVRWRGDISCNSLAFTPDGKTLSAWSADLFAWDVATGQQRRVTKTGWNYGVPLSPDWPKPTA